ncbi:MAG: hypothetical protein SGI77_13520 [Pirellulaceae bacterium]|nr:hypothetical protein [Pirellulaceae bacterium]
MARRLGDILVADGFVSAQVLQDAIANKATGVMLGDWLVQAEIITHEQLRDV